MTVVFDRYLSRSILFRKQTQEEFNGQYSHIFCCAVVNHGSHSQIGKARGVRLLIAAEYVLLKISITNKRTTKQSIAPRTTKQ